MATISYLAFFIKSTLTKMVFPLFLGLMIILLPALPVNAQNINLSPNNSVNQNTNQSSIAPNQNQICGNQTCPILDISNIRFTNRDDLNDFIIRTAQFLTYIGVPLAVLFLVFGGIQLMFGKTDSGWKCISTTLVGMVIIFVSYTAVALITQLLSQDILGQTFIDNQTSSIVR